MKDAVPGADAGANPARRGLAPIAAVAARVTKPLLKKRGLAQARVLTEWPAIVGPKFAERSLPERFWHTRAGEGTLRLRVAGIWALEFQHLEPVLRERINAYFGYALVSRIVLVQGTLPGHRPPGATARPLTSTEDGYLAAAALIEDPELRERLVGLGRAVLQRAQGAAARLPKSV
jgi:hypothetical protein